MGAQHPADPRPRLDPGRHAEDVARLLDRCQIEDLVMAYARARDRTDPDAYREVFAPDAQLVLADGRVLSDGLPQILAKVEGDRTRFNPSPAEAPGGSDGQSSDPAPVTAPNAVSWSIMRHVVTNLIVTVDGDHAEAEYYVLTVAQDPEHGGPGLVSMGRSHDLFERRGSRWWLVTCRLAYDWGDDRLGRLLGLGPHSPRR